jgi:hypothetical protein
MSARLFHALSLIHRSVSLKHCETDRTSAYPQADRAIFNNRPYPFSFQTSVNPYPHQSVKPATRLFVESAGLSQRGIPACFTLGTPLAITTASIT